MKLASIIQNGMQPPLKIDAGLLKFTSISTSNHFPKWVHLHLTNSTNFPGNVTVSILNYLLDDKILFSFLRLKNCTPGVCGNAWLRKSLIVRAKGVEQEEESVSSGEILNLFKFFRTTVGTTVLRCRVV